LAEGKPEVVKTAAKIKQDQDMKKQKLKAIKFLAEVGCGCYNKDDQVAKALLEALNDCDPDVKKAAIEAISQNAAACNKCSNGCETTCCNADVVKKLEEMAVGIDDKGCPKEPDREIRAAAMAALKRCGCPPEKDPEEIPAPPEIEEVPTPVPPPDIEIPEAPKADIEVPDAASVLPQETKRSWVTKVSFSGGDTNIVAPAQPISPSHVEASPQKASARESFGDGTEPVRLAQRKSKEGQFISAIANADQLVRGKVADVGSSKRSLGVMMPQAYDLQKNQQLILVDRVGNIQVGSIDTVEGNQISVTFDSESVLTVDKGDGVRVGLLNQ
jgi:hypothetical protein